MKIKNEKVKKAWRMVKGIGISASYIFAYGPLAYICYRFRTQWPEENLYDHSYKAKAISGLARWF